MNFADLLKKAIEERIAEEERKNRQCRFCWMMTVAMEERDK